MQPQSFPPHRGSCPPKADVQPPATLRIQGLSSPQVHAQTLYGPHPATYTAGDSKYSNRHPKATTMSTSPAQGGCTTTSIDTHVQGPSSPQGEAQTSYGPCPAVPPGTRNAQMGIPQTQTQYQVTSSSTPSLQWLKKVSQCLHVFH